MCGLCEMSVWGGGDTRYEFTWEYMLLTVHVWSSKAVSVSFCLRLINIHTMHTFESSMHINWCPEDTTHPHGDWCLAHYYHGQTVFNNRIE